MKHLVALAAMLPGLAIAAPVQITEWQYNGSEFVEFTNRGATAVDFGTYSYSDSARTPGDVSLAGFGVVLAGESVILAEVTAAAFRALWSLPASVKVQGSNTANLGRSDEINLYDGATLLDRLTYNDQDSNAGPRTQNTSGRPGSAAALGANNDSLWVLAAVGDVEGSVSVLSGTTTFIGSPGRTSFNQAPVEPAPVPEPASAAMLLAGLGVAFGWRKRR